MKVPAAPEPPTPDTRELWALIRAYGGARADCDRSNGAINQQYLKLAESNLRDVIDALAQAAIGAPPDMLAVCAALGFDPTNHHNAAKCPYCRPSVAVGTPAEPLLEALAELVDALDATNWSSWQTTARFSEQLERARAVLAGIAPSIPPEPSDVHQSGAQAGASGAVDGDRE